MKQIEAIIRKSKFDDVKEALHKIEVNFFVIGTLPGLETRNKVMCIGASPTVQPIFKEGISPSWFPTSF